MSDFLQVIGTLVIVIWVIFITVSSVQVWITNHELEKIKAHLAKALELLEKNMGSEEDDNR